MQIPDISRELIEYTEAVNEPRISHVRDFVQKEVETALNKVDGLPRSSDAMTRRLELLRFVMQTKTEQIKPDFSDKQAQSIDHFRESPRSIAKLMQRIFTADPELQVFFREGDINSVVIDPRMITDRMLEIFGLDEFKPQKEGSSKRISELEKVQARAGAIPEIKRFFAESIEPLASPKHLRLFRITQGKNAGLIMGTQNNGNKVNVFMTNLNGAYRRIDDIEEGHKAEIAKLQGISFMLRTITKRVYGKWNQPEVKEQKETFLSQIAETVRSLQYVKNEQKAELLNRLRMCLKFEDKTGRTNPGSRIAVWNSTHRFIDKRIEEISRISGYLAGDRMRVFSQMQGEANRLNEFNDDVEKHKDELRILDVNKPLSERRRQKILDNLTGLARTCDTFRYEPYLTLAREMKKEIQEVIDYLRDEEDEKQSRPEARYHFMKTYTLAKLVRMQKNLLDLREQFFKPGYNPASVYLLGVLRSLERIFADFNSKDVAPKVKVTRYNRVYGEVKNKLREIVETARNGLRKGEASRINAVIEVDKLLKEFSLAEIMDVDPKFQKMSKE